MALVLVAVSCSRQNASGTRPEAVAKAEAEAEAEAQIAPEAGAVATAAEPAEAGPDGPDGPAATPGIEPASAPPGVTTRGGPPQPVFKKVTLPLEQLAHMVAGAPELARLGGGIAMFDPGDNPYLRRSKADREDFVFTPLPLLWSPEPGVEVLLVVGRGKEGSFVTAWWPLPDGSYRLASSFLMLGEVAPVALAYRTAERSPWWTTCWKCSGETGRVTLRPDHHVVILPD
jgi:hypothetical protein